MGPRALAGRASGLIRRAPGRLRDVVDSGGARESGLASVTVVTALQTFSDTLVAVALAGTLFFSVPVGDARGNVALYLLVTMAPFVLLAPLVGPTLDRFPHARRYALAATAVGRALLAWYLVGAVDAVGLYPAALGVLVLSRGFHIGRAAAVPRVLPDGVTLVAANARLNLAGFVGGVVGAATGGLLAWVGGTTAVLVGACAGFAALAYACVRLPHAIDSSSDGGGHGAEGTGAEGTGPRTVPMRTSFGPAVVSALRSAAALRVLAGFLTLYLVFVIREEETGWRATLLLGALAAAAGGGSVLGATAGLRLPLSRPEVTAAWLLFGATVVCVLGALAFSMATGLLVAFVAGVTSSLGKLAADATVQRDVAEELRASAFARTETVLQLAWVAGGFLGIVLPLSGTVGFAVVAALLTVALLTALVSLRSRSGTGGGSAG